MARAGPHEDQVVRADLRPLPRELCLAVELSPAGTLEIVLDDALADDVPIRTLYLDVVQASLQEVAIGALGEALDRTRRRALAGKAEPGRSPPAREPGRTQLQAPVGWCSRLSAPDVSSSSK